MDANLFKQEHCVTVGSMCSIGINVIESHAPKRAQIECFFIVIAVANGFSIAILINETIELIFLPFRRKC